MAIKTNGTNHPALFGLSYEKTVDFYTRVLGMRLVLEQPNLDDPDSVHLFFETGPGQFIAYFVPRPGQAREGRVPTGALAHIALNLTSGLDDAMASLTSEGVCTSTAPSTAATSAPSTSVTPTASSSSC